MGWSVWARAGVRRRQAREAQKDARKTELRTLNFEL
jgi:hypothetical protein